MSTPAGGAGSGRDWLSKHIPLDIQQLIISFLPPEVIANPEANIALINHVFREVMNKPMTWDILAKTWKIEVEKPKLEKGEKLTKEAHEALFKLTKAAVLAHLKQVTDIAIKCIPDPEVRAKIEKLDPLARYALIGEQLSNNDSLGFIFYNQILKKSAKEQSIAASKLFAQLLFGNVPKPDTFDDTFWIQILRDNLSTAIQIGSLEAVKLLLKAGYNPYENALENAIRSYAASQTTWQKQERLEIIQLVLDQDFFRAIPQSESYSEKLFKLAFDTGDLRIIKMLQRHGLVPPEASKEYAREQVKKNHELHPLLDQLLKPKD